MSERIGIFGGSFDPVHLGHRKLAEFMLSAAGLDRIIIVPAALSPFKSVSGAPAEDRLDMCRAQFPESCFTVSDTEIRRGGKSYTVDTVRETAETYPEASLSLIIGSDQLLSFNKWYHFEEILKSARLLAVSRNSCAETEALRAFAEENLSKFGDVGIFEFEPFAVNSTSLREKIKNGENTAAFIGGEVLSIIESRGLYLDRQ